MSYKYLSLYLVARILSRGWGDKSQFLFLFLFLFSFIHLQRGYLALLLYIDSQFLITSQFLHNTYLNTKAPHDTHKDFCPCLTIPTPRLTWPFSHRPGWSVTLQNTGALVLGLLFTLKAPSCFEVLLPSHSVFHVVVIDFEFSS